MLFSKMLDMRYMTQHIQVGYPGNIIYQLSTSI